MEIQRHFVARVIYRHRSKQERHVTLIVFRDRQEDLYLLVQSDCCYAEPECWDGSRADVLEQWRHLNRALRSEWFLYDKLASSDPDFAEIL